MVEIPGYTIEEELGRGGMATVFAAMQLSVERRVALKVMSKVLLVDSSFSERFMREARIAASLYHPHVVAVHDVGVFDDSHYIAMEYLSGGDLAARCGEHIQLVSVVRVVREIASALHYAHSKGFVHRDVKPENILFRDDGSAVLTDFGIARAVNSATQMTRTGAVIGTPQYMSPEQARGKDLDGRSDLYGLGIVFYEMLTGKVPFEGNDSVAVGIKHVTEPVPRLPDKLNYIQPILEKFLAKRPEDRYQSGGEALLDLKDLERKVLSGETPAVVGEPRQTRVSDPNNAGAATSLSPEPPTRAMATPQTLEPETRPMPTPDPASSTPPGSRTTAARASQHISATPRPDGSLRQEPRLGAIDDIHSFDRTVGQPKFEPEPPARKPLRLGWLIALILVAGLAAVGVWQQERIASLLPNREVDRWLAQAEQAGDFGRWYGDSSDYANVLYQRVLQADPGNRRALAGMELVALHLCDRAEQAIADGNPRQAELLLQRARELAPDLPRIAEVSAKLVAPGELPAQDQRLVQPGAAEAPDNRQRIEALLSEAAQRISAGRLVRPLGDSALGQFQAVLALEPDNPAARAGISQIGSLLSAQFDRAMSEGDLEAADDALGQLAVVEEDPERLRTARERLDAERDQRRAAETARQVRDSRIAQLLQEGQALLRRGRLAEPPGENAVNRFRSVLRADPDNAAARDGLKQVAQRFLSLTEQALEEDRLDEAERMIGSIQDLNPDLPGLDRVQRRLTIYREQNQRNAINPQRQAELESLLVRAEAALAAGQLMSPPGSSAYDTYKAALRIDPDNAAARAGLRSLSGALIDQAEQLLQQDNLAGAIARFVDADQMDPGSARVVLLRTRLAAAARDDARVAIESGRFADAEQLLTQASDLEPGSSDLDQLQLELNIARDATGG